MSTLLHGDDPTSLLGKTLDKYKLTKNIGSGAYGLVYTAVDLDARHGSDNVNVAIKLVPYSMGSEDPDRTGTCAHEVAIMEEMAAAMRRHQDADHPMSDCVVRLLDHLTGVIPDRRGVDHMYCAIVMELMDGDFANVVIINAAMAYRLCMKIADCLWQLHSMGFCHGDIKPANVLWRNVGNAFVVKFGDLGQTCACTVERCTFTGTPAYMPYNYGTEFSVARHHSPITDHERRALDCVALLYTMRDIMVAGMTGVTPYAATRARSARGCSIDVSSLEVTREGKAMATVIYGTGDLLYGATPLADSQITAQEIACALRNEQFV